MAGYVPRGSNPGELDIDVHISQADQRVMSLSSCYAVVAADEALADAGWKPESKEQRERTGQFPPYLFYFYLSVKRDENNIFII